MRWIGILIITAAAAFADERTALDQSRVILSYGELKTLLAAAQPKPEPPPAVAPVPVAVLSASYDLSAEPGFAEGTATFDLQSMEKDALLLPLIGSGARITQVEPAETLLVLEDDRYAVVLPGKARLKVTLHFRAPVVENSPNWQLALPIPRSALSSLKLHNVGADQKVLVGNATMPSAEKNNAGWALGATDLLKLSVEAAPVVRAPEQPQVHVETPAIVKTATSEMRVVRDGSYINTMVWTLSHDSAMSWTLSMPEGCQLLSCKVADQPVAPALEGGNKLVISLPAPSGRQETPVELVYTGKKEPFEPVRGELAIDLPSTTLLVEGLVWGLRIPEPYETVALQGNVDFQPARNGEIILTKELGRGEAPSMHLYYQKPETTKKP